MIKENKLLNNVFLLVLGDHLESIQSPLHQIFRPYFRHSGSRECTLKGKITARSNREHYLYKKNHKMSGLNPLQCR